MNQSNLLKSICQLLLESKTEDARALLQNKYPHKHIELDKRSYSLKEKMEQFLRDGFIDRYTGEKLVNPGILKVITNYFPDEFPYDPHWKMTKTHGAYWDLIPTIDHIVPIAQGGIDAPSNWATTSMKNNSIKSNYSLDEIHWKLYPKGNLSEWDGLTNLFLSLVESNMDLQKDSYIRSWYKISKTAKLPVNAADIVAFSKKWIEKFSNKGTDYVELVDHYFADECSFLGFKMDCGKAFEQRYGDAVYNSDALKCVIDGVDDILLLGSAIYSRWRYFNHWAYDAAEILNKKNREWFILALSKLLQLQKGR